MPPRYPDPVRQARAKRLREKREALKKLEALAELGVVLKRHVFFIPGWAGDEGYCWTRPYDRVPKGHGPARVWFNRIVRNHDRMTFLRFSLKASRSCENFFDFAQILKGKIRRVVRDNQPIDLIGHSMGGLDIMAALTHGPRPLRNVVSAIAVASPLGGVFYGRLVKRIEQLLPGVQWTDHHLTQVRNLDRRSSAIRRINATPVRRRLLHRLEGFACVEGSRDYVVMRSARLRTQGLPASLRRKVTSSVIGGAEHTNRLGVTQDPRTILRLLSIVAGLPIPKPSRNYGLIYQRT